MIVGRSCDASGIHDNWVPACGGTERPFTMRGRRFWYMWNMETGEHAYLDLDRDVFLTNDEVNELWRI